MLGQEESHLLEEFMTVLQSGLCTVLLVDRMDAFYHVRHIINPVICETNIWHTSVRVFLNSVLATTARWTGRSETRVSSCPHFTPGTIWSFTFIECPELYQSLAPRDARRDFQMDAHYTHRRTLTRIFRGTSSSSSSSRK